MDTETPTTVLDAKAVKTVERKNLFNILKKANDGKPLSKAELRLLAASVEDKQKLEYTDEQARALAVFDPVLEKGKAIADLLNIFNMAMDQANPELALNVRKELNKLQNLYPADSTDDEILKILTGQP